MIHSLCKFSLLHLSSSNLFQISSGTFFSVKAHSLKYIDNGEESELSIVLNKPSRVAFSMTLFKNPASANICSAVLPVWLVWLRLISQGLSVSKALVEMISLSTKPNNTVRVQRS